MVSSKAAIKALRDAGWQIQKGRGKGSHTVLKDPATGATTVVPQGREDLGRGLTRAIERQSGVRLT